MAGPRCGARTQPRACGRLVPFWLMGVAPPERVAPVVRPSRVGISFTRPGPGRQPPRRDRALVLKIAGAVAANDGEETQNHTFIELRTA